MVNKNLFNEMCDTVRVIKNIAKNSKSENYSLEDVKKLLTIEQWRHIVVLMKVLRRSESVPNTGNITKFNREFCNLIFHCDYDSFEKTNTMSTRLVECFSIALSQVGKITTPMVHLAEILTQACGKNMDTYYAVMHKTAINELFYDNYVPCDGDFCDIINRSSRSCTLSFVKKYFIMPNGLLMLDNALILTTIVNDGWTDSKINNKIVETIQKRLLNYAISSNNNTYYTIKQYSDLYNTIAEKIAYNDSFDVTIKRQMNLLEQTIINRVVDFSDPIHEIIFDYPKDMRLTALYSTGFGTKGNIVERISNVMERNATILKRYYKNTSKKYPIDFSFGLYLSTYGNPKSYLTARLNNDTIIVLNKPNQLEAATKYSLLIVLNKELNKLFDETTAAKIFLTSVKRLETLIYNYYSKILDINLDIYKTHDMSNKDFYDGKIDWNMVENEAETYVQTLLKIFERVYTPSCTVEDYPPIVRIAVAYYYSQTMLNFDKLESSITGKIADNYVKTMFGDIKVETFNHLLREHMKQLLAARIKDINIINNNVDNVVKEWEFYALCRYPLKSGYVAETIKNINVDNVAKI